MSASPLAGTLPNTIVNIATKSLEDLPYDILLNICDQLVDLGTKVSPEDPVLCVCEGCLRYASYDEITPMPPHPTPRRAHKRGSQLRDRRALDWAKYEASRREGGPIIIESETGPFASVSVFDGLSRTSTYFRDVCAPYLFRNVVLASGDCMTLDRLEFYSRPNWMLKHVRSLRFYVVEDYWIDGLDAETPPDDIPDGVANAVRLITSLPNLHTLQFGIQPSQIRSPFKKAILQYAAEFPALFPNVRNLSIMVGSEFMISLCGAKAGLEELEYSIDECSGKVYFRSLPCKGITDQRAAAMIEGIENLSNNKLRKLTIGPVMTDSGFECLAPLIPDVTELNLTGTAPSQCARELALAPQLRTVRYERDAEASSASNQYCYMPYPELLTIIQYQPHLERIWYTNRFVCHVPPGGLVKEDMTMFCEPGKSRIHWRDTWAADGIGKPDIPPPARPAARVGMAMAGPRPPTVQITVDPVATYLAMTNGTCPNQPGVQIALSSCSQMRLGRGWWS